LEYTSEELEYNAGGIIKSIEVSEGKIFIENDEYPIGNILIYWYDDSLVDDIMEKVMNEADEEGIWIFERSFGYYYDFDDFIHKKALENNLDEYADGLSPDQQSLLYKDPIDYIRDKLGEEILVDYINKKFLRNVIQENLSELVEDDDLTGGIYDILQTDDENYYLFYEVERKEDIDDSEIDYDAQTWD
jgi:hypothetical protein